MSLKGRPSIQVEEALQYLRPGRMPQFAQCFSFDLTDALSGDIELFADFLKGVIGVHVDAKPHPQNLGFPFA